MVKLPTPGGDAGNWGAILNEFLEVEHNTNGTLKAGGSLAMKADQSAVNSHTSNATIHRSINDTTSSATSLWSSSKVSTELATKATSSHTHTASNVSDFSEAVDDRVNTLIVAGTGISKTYDDTANTLTLEATGGGEGATSLDGLTDVSVTSAVLGDIIRRNGTQFINTPSQYIDAVADYGADNTGASDATAALQNAINAAGSAKKRLIIPTGNYRINTRLNAVSNLTIDAYGAVIQRYNSDLGNENTGVGSPTFLISGVQNVFITGLTVDGRKTSFTASQFAHCMALIGSQNVVLRDVLLTNGNGDGLIINGDGDQPALPYNEGLLCLNLICKGNRRNGLSVSKGKNLNFISCSFVETRDVNPEFGVDIEPDTSGSILEDITFIACKANNNNLGGLSIALTQNPTVPQRGIRWIGGELSNNGDMVAERYAVGAGFGYSYDVLLQDVAIRNNTNAGIALSRSMSNVTIRHCIIENNETYGIDGGMYTGGQTLDRLRIQDCDIVDNAQESPSGHPYEGIYLTGAKDVIISGTRVTGNHDWGIRTTAGVSQLTIENCDLTGNDGNGAASLSDEASTRRVVNTRGYVSDSRGAATVAAGSTSIVVSHGLAQTPPLDGIKVTPTNNMGSATKYWISTPTATQFTINVDVAPGGSGATFSWNACI